MDALKRKDAPFGVLDTHAGVGLYDFDAAEAQRSPELRDGVARLWDWDNPPTLIRAYLDLVRASNPDGKLRFYPGSPAIIAALLRAQDRLAACELHPDDAAELRARFARSANVQIHARDGWEALQALLPLPERRGLVLIDPPYEEPGELEHAAHAISGALKRFGHGIYLWWRPLKSESALARVDAEVKAQGARETLRADLWIDTPTPQGKLVGSSLLLINPPFGLEAALRETLPLLAEKLAIGAGGGYRIA
ncbi:MAG: 23S rRNA (adenine(2030)-N(6))-methyltransferase RlmJ [Alphaproteobacteria bacterium]